MSVMAFSQMMGNLENVKSNLELARAKYSAEGASRVGGSVAMTGAAINSFTLSSIWESADACFAARGTVLADPEMRPAITASEGQPLGFMIGDLKTELGQCEGTYAVAVGATTTDHSDDAVAAVAGHNQRLFVANGVNGVRTVRLNAAGEFTGAYANIFYTDSLDAYFNGSAAAGGDTDFLATSAKIGATIVDRTISRMV